MVRSVNNANLILPAGDVQIGPLDYNIYTNSQLSTIAEINQLPVKTVGQAPVRVADIGYRQGRAADPDQPGARGWPALGLRAGAQAGRRHQHHRRRGRHQGRGVSTCSTCPKNWSRKVVFDQSVFVKTAIETLLHEGAIGLFLTSLMILIFLGSMRATRGGVLLDSAFGAGGLHRALASAAARSTAWCWAAWRWPSRA